MSASSVVTSTSWFLATNRTNLLTDVAENRYISIAVTSVWNKCRSLGVAIEGFMCSVMHS